MMVMPLHHSCAGHGIFGLGDLTGSHVGDAQRRKAERIVRLQLGRPQGVLDSILMLAESRIDHRKCRVGEGIVGVSGEQFFEFRGGFVQLPRVLQFVGLVVRLLGSSHRARAPLNFQDCYQCRVYQLYRPVAGLADLAVANANCRKTSAPAGRLQNRNATVRSPVPASDLERSRR